MWTFRLYRVVQYRENEVDLFADNIEITHVNRI
jgi:hypothetical protein